MTNALAEAILNLKSKYTTTQNGAKTLVSTGDAVLDFFSRANAMRKDSSGKIFKLFNDALSENTALTIAALFYLRDIRGGQGERALFRKLLNSLALNHPDLARKVISFVPVYGRWDDLFTFLGTSLHKDVLNILSLQLTTDAGTLLESNNSDKESISLCAKWMPSENSGKRSKYPYYQLKSALGISPKEYRLLMSFLRKHISLVEHKMCANEWSLIDYTKVPSKASLMYRKAFKKHDAVRYAEFIDAVKKGQTKINAATLYPYEIVEKIYNTKSRDETLEQLWYNLPDYVGEQCNNNIAVVDVSGSMNGTPMSVAVSLGLYLAERNKSEVWKDMFITFSQSPKLVKIKGANLTEKVRNIYKSDWGYNTNLQAVFTLILDAAISNKLNQSDLPEVLYIISDMQFDNACANNNKTNLDIINQKFKKAGYKRPKLVFWNVKATKQESPAKANENDIALFSGLSPVIFKSVFKGELNPQSAMLDVLVSERYLPVIEAVM